MENRPREIKVYVTEDGKCPFEDWLKTLRDARAKATIRSRLDRVLLGLLGDHRFVVQGVFEFKIDCGPEYRVYFSQVGTMVLLLCGGDKSTQRRDIRQAQRYWKDYEQREGSS